MTISYDFDICPVAEPSGDNAFVALWRDPRAADALKRSPEWLQELFFQSRFGVEASGRVLPAGTYLLEEEQERDQVIETFAAQVVEKVPEFKDGGLPHTPFDLSEFIDSLETAEIYDEDDLDQASAELAAIHAQRSTGAEVEEAPRRADTKREGSISARQVVLGAIVCYAIGIAGSVVGVPLLSTVNSVSAESAE